MGEEVKGKLANAVGIQYPSHYLGTWFIHHYYRWCAHLGLPAVDWTDAPTDRFKWTRPFIISKEVDWSWNVMAHGEAREGKWRGNWRMMWVDSTLRTTSEHGVSSITTADPALLPLMRTPRSPSSRLNWRPHRADLNGLVRFARKTKCGFCACAVTFVLASTDCKNNSVPVSTVYLTRI